MGDLRTNGPNWRHYNYRKRKGVGRKDEANGQTRTQSDSLGERQKRGAVRDGLLAVPQKKKKQCMDAPIVKKGGDHKRTLDKKATLFDRT